jgi:hypothetical protein
MKIRTIEEEFDLEEEDRGPDEYTTFLKKEK